MLKDVFIYTLKCLLYFWCPFGRASRKEYAYYNNTTLVLALLVVAAIKYLPPHKLEWLYAFANEFKVALCCICAVVVLASYSVLVRRGQTWGIIGFLRFSAPQSV